MNISQTRSSYSCVRSPMKSRTFLMLVLGLINTGLVNAHQGQVDSSDTEGVEHAKQDAYWAEKAKDFPAFVAPAARTIESATRPVDDGAWGPVIDWPHIPVTAANLPDGRILTFSSNQKTAFPAGPEFTYAATWDPATNTFLERNHNSHDMFCGHLSTLEDGRIFVNGGRSHTKVTSTFDYRTNTWQTVDLMNRGRWYPTTVAMPSGSVLTAIGSSGGEYPELWTEGQGWKSLTGASLQSPILSYTQFFERNWWPLLHVDPRGKVFHSGPTPKMHSIGTQGLGSVTKVGPENNGWYPKHGATIMYDEGKILVAGGAISGSNTKSTNKAMIIDITNEEPQVTQIPPMNHARKFQNGVMLPTGEVLIVGGNSSGVKFSDSGTVLSAEIWNPETRTWRVIDSMSKPRNYHSIALLLTDGRVLAAGGGLCGGCATNHQNGQVLTPPYLFNADGTLASRPVISNVASTIKNGQQFNLQSSTDITKFSMIKMSSTTHAVNTDQRFVKVPFTHDGAGNYQLTAHSNINVLTPGHWMLFAVNSNGVPSVAKVVKVTSVGLPQVTQPSNQSNVIGESASLAIVATDPDGQSLRYQATGLPNGLSINANTGLISGQTTTAGTFSVKITVTDNESSIETHFSWYVFPAGSPPGVSYEYFEGSWSILPNFDTLTPVASGTFNNFNIAPRARNDNFAFRLSSRIKISQAGNYTFYTSSDDGSRLWVNGNLVVDNDGLHGMQERSGTISLSAGEHAIVVGFFERTGGEGLSVQYSSSSISKRQIPSASLVQNPLQNVAPSINNPGNQVSSLNATNNLAIIASDNNGDSLSYSASGLPNGLSINPSTGVISGTSNTAGSFAVTVNVNDGQGESSSVSFDWDVIAPISISPIESSPKLRGTSVVYNAVVSGGSSLRYSWNFGDGSTQTSFTGSPSTSHTFSNSGTYVVTLFVQEGSETPVEYQFVQAVYSPLTADKPTHSSSIAYESFAGNDRVWAANPDNDTVTAYDAVMHAKLAEIAVSARPQSLAIAPNGRLWVTNKDASQITIINTTNFTIAQTVTLKAGSQPHGITFSPNGNFAYIALEGSGQLLQLNALTASITRTLNVGDRPRHVSVNSDSTKVFVSRFITPVLPDEDTSNPKTTVNGINYGGEVLVVNSSNLSLIKTIILQHSNAQDAEHSARGIPNYLGPVVISPNGASAWVSSKQDNIKRGMLRDGRQLTHDSTVRSISSRINLNTETESLVSRVDHDNGGIASTSIFSNTGSYLFVALEGSREIAVVDAFSNEEFYRFDAGRAPQGLALSTDGLTLYSHNFMDRTVTAHDISNIVNTRGTQAPLISIYDLVSNEKLALNVFNGKQLFYDARDQRLASEQYISCASCHNEGDSDGRVWDMTGLGEGLRNTIGLVGHGGMAHGPLHWTANFDEVQDFEGQIRDLSGGTGLMSNNNFHFGTRSEPLGDRKTGLSQALDDLSAYVSSLDTMPVSPYKNLDGSLTTLARQGQQIFLEKGCNSCHSGNNFTDSSDSNLHNIGTLRSSSGSRLSNTLTGIDTPTLQGLWLTAPYLHNGSATTVEEAISAHVNISTTTSERTALASYLLQLDDSSNNSSSGDSNEVAIDQISIDGLDSDWSGLSSFANDANDVSGTNNPINIRNISIAHDAQNVYVLYRNYGNIDPENISGDYLAWGWQAYFDTDNNSSTGYQVGNIGADYILEGNQVMRYTGTGSSWDWIRIGEGPSFYSSNIAEIKFSRSLLSNPDSFRFVFIGANEAYGGSVADFYPDDMNNPQSNQSYFEYQFQSGGVVPPQNAPIAIAQNVTITQNSEIAITLEGSDPESDPLTYSIVSNTTNGVLSGSGRNLTYKPNLGFLGTDSFTFIVNDGSQDSAEATVTISVIETQTGIISNPVITVDVDGNASEWSGLVRFDDDSSEPTVSGNIIDWQNAAMAHNSQKVYLLYKNRNIIESGAGTYIPWGWQAYIDSDDNASTGYQLGDIGADYILEGDQLHRYIGSGTDWNLASPVQVETWYNNDIIEVSFNRTDIGSPSKIRVVFFGNNEAYEGTSVDEYPDSAESNGYFSYSFLATVQGQNRPTASSQSLSTGMDSSISINLNTANLTQEGLVYRILNQPKNGVLSGSGSSRNYTPNTGFEGVDEIRYVIQNGIHQSSIYTVQLRVNQESIETPTTPPPASGSGSGGGVLPLNLLLVLVMIFIYRFSSLRKKSF